MKSEPLLKALVALLGVFSIVAVLLGYRVYTQHLDFKERLVEFEVGLAQVANQLDYHDAGFSPALKHPEQVGAALQKLADHAVAARATVGQLKEQVVDEQGDRAAVDEQLAAAKTEWADTRQTIASLRRDLNQLRAQVDSASTKNRGLRDVLAEKEKGSEQLQGTIAEYEDRLAEQQVMIDDLKRGIDETRKPAANPEVPKVAGKIITVNKDWNFVVVNLGREHGLKVNAQGVVHREDKLLGKVKIAKLEGDAAVADVMDGWAIGDLVVGDSIFFDPGTM